MALLDSILGGSNNEATNVNSNASESNQDFASNPNFDFNANDVLQSASYSADGEDGDVNYESFSGVGDIGIDAASPIQFSNSNSESSFSGSQTETDGGGGGLLGGLL